MQLTDRRHPSAHQRQAPRGSGDWARVTALRWPVRAQIEALLQDRLATAA